MLDSCLGELGEDHAENGTVVLGVDTDIGHLDGLLHGLQGGLVVGGDDQGAGIRQGDGGHILVDLVHRFHRGNGGQTAGGGVVGHGGVLVAAGQAGDVVEHAHLGVILGVELGDLVGQLQNGGAHVRIAVYHASGFVENSEGRVITVFEPHTYSRTKYLLKDFTTALANL